MPVEIRELVIRATVEADETGTAAGRSSGGQAGMRESERARLIAECVEQVMETLREQRER